MRQVDLRHAQMHNTASATTPRSADGPRRLQRPLLLQRPPAVMRLHQHWRHIRFAMAIAAGAVLPAAAWANSPMAHGATMVQLASGRITGVQQRGITHFEDLPFPASADDDVLATSRHDSADARARHAQAPLVHAPRVQTRRAQTPRVQAGRGVRPACPTLSVWTPRVPEPNGNASRTAQTMLPVLIWIDSSAHAQASAHDDGARLAEKAVVVVLLRHRTAASACLTAPSNTLNRALTVQLAALIWVNRNIASFGGDSARVTIVGIGAGAASAQALLAMPRARRYFSQVAAFDGHALRALPACTMPERVPVRADDDVYGSVCIDGKLLQAQIHQSARAGGLAPVPVLLGLSRQPERSNGGLASQCHDSTSAAQLTMEQLAQRAHYAQWLAAEFGPLARDAAHFYPPTTPCRSYLLARYDRQQTYGVLRWADLQTKSSAAVFLAVASAAASAAGTPQQIDRGAWSALLMNNPNALTARGNPPDVDLLMLADTLSDYLVAFATRGDPSTPGRPQWPAYDSGIRNYLELSGNVHTARDPLREVLELHAARSEGTWRP